MISALSWLSSTTRIHVFSRLMSGPRRARSGGAGEGTKSADIFLRGTTTVIFVPVPNSVVSRIVPCMSSTSWKSRKS